MHQKQKTTGLVWFQNNLRVQDNKSLQLACKQHQNVIATFIFDTDYFQQTQFGFQKTGVFRVQFLLETIANLKKNLAKLNITLLTYFDNSSTRISKICAAHSIDEIYVQKEWTSEEKDAINSVKAQIPASIKITETFDQFLFHPEDIQIDFKNIPQVFTNFRKKLEKYVSVRKETLTISKNHENVVQNNTIIPSLNTLGFAKCTINTKSAFPFKGGEDAANSRLEDYFFNTKKLRFYKQTRNGLLGLDYSSKFSAWLANGSISAKTIYWNVKNHEYEFGANDSTYWLIFELIWRDYFKYISLKHGNSIFKISGILQKHYEWKNDKQKIQQWINGKTKEPFVNANMIELQQTGWMSNRGRQNVASFFAKELQLDWRIGAAYFEALLLDYDVHSNYGNWMYVAGVGNDPRDRKFNIKSQAERYDPSQKYQKTWLQTSLF